MASPDRLFRRYRRTRDPELLARVFDATAPRLLRLAIHLSRDAAEAEDLVQATFLAAIERPESFEAKGEVLPWLLGILGNKARHARRQAARRVEPGRLVERVVATPFEEATAAELSGELARAIDALDEPYRRVLVLRLRHGMSAPDIAHALDLSPGAVRVRLSRGVERLRRALPVGLASALALSALPERGLAAVRAAVLGEARAAALVAGTSTLTLGGLLMTKKLALGSLALVVALAATALLHRPTASRGAEDAASPGEARLAAAPPEPLVPATEPAPTPDAPRVALETEPASPTETLAGVVFDAATGDPLAGVLVELFPAEELLFSELKRREYPFVEQRNGDGGLRSLATWPLLDGRPSEAQRLDAEPLLTWTRPLPGSTPFASARTDAAGRFDIAFPPRGGTLVSSLAGFGTRTVPVREREAELRVAMRRPGRLAGYLLDTSGERIAASIDVVFHGTVEEPPEEASGEWPTKEAWRVTTQADGSFDVELPAAYVWARSASPDWILVHTGVHPTHQQPWVFWSSWHPGRPKVCACGEEEPVFLVAQHVPVIHVTDARTGAPIEHFRMIGRELAKDDPVWSGSYSAPEGVLQIGQEYNGDTDLPDRPFELVVWADGYAAATRTFTDAWGDGVIEIPLERGELPAIQGLALRNGAPLAGASVALQPYYRAQWRADPRKLAALARTDSAGAFALNAPAGPYLLHVVIDDEQVHAEPVELPRDAYRTIDIGGLGRVVVEVRDSDGTLQVDHTVALRSDEGRQETRYTDETGRVEFTLVPAGAYRVHVPNVSTRTSFSGGIVEHFDVADGATAFVPVTVPAIGAPRHARLVADTERDFDGWRAQAWGQDQVDVRPDGLVPIDLQLLTIRSLTVEDPEHRRWQVSVPDPPPEDFEIQVVLDGPRLEGTLLDIGTGEPIRDARVAAAPVGSDGGSAPSPSVTTDREGRFVIPCAREVAHRLSLEAGSSVFVTASPASRHPASMTIRMPRSSDGGLRGLATKHVHGRVVRETSGEPQPGARVWVHALLPQAHGTLEIYLTVAAGPGGEYELSVPDAPRYRVSVYEPGINRPAVTDEWDGLAGVDEEWDLVLP